jgi:hypothetical protein
LDLVCVKGRLGTPFGLHLDKFGCFLEGIVGNRVGGQIERFAEESKAAQLFLL